MSAPGLLQVGAARMALPLHDTAATRVLESEAQAARPAHALMARAGESAARLVMAVAPHARCIGVLAGPGNNGGDGLVAARHLRSLGRDVSVLHLTADPTRLPPDAAHAWQLARSADLRWVDGPAELQGCGLVVDALLGLGAARPPEGRVLEAVGWCSGQRHPVLSIDLPTGLDADSGRLLGAGAIRADWTLSLLSLKPGLFTAAGREHAGEVWFDDLGTGTANGAQAWLGSSVCPPPGSFPARRHSQHKGSFGDVIVVGGAPGMWGAMVLAGRSALAAGAGRVYLSPLDPRMPVVAPAELMSRPEAWRDATQRLAPATVVCGCGGGDAVGDAMPRLLECVGRLVLDADALNAVAGSPTSRSLVRARAGRGLATLLTPHPLEAARLLGASTQEVQADRLGAARRLAQDFLAVILLKGSGTVVAAPDQGLGWINGNGNARLATPGSGDVLAGWIGGLWAQSDPAQPARSAWDAARAAAWLHGFASDRATGSPASPLAAGDLIDWMARLVPGRSA